MAFSGDGRLLAAIDRSEVLLWLVGETPTLLARWPCRGLAVAFGPDDRTLLTASTGFTARLWDLGDPNNPQQLASEMRAGRSVFAAAMNPRGDLMLTAAAGGWVAWWSLAGFGEMRRDPLTRACAFVGRGLNQAEWNRYVSGVPFRATCG